MKKRITYSRIGASTLASRSLPAASKQATRAFCTILALGAVASAQAQPRAYVSTDDSLAVVDTATNTLGGVLGPLLTAGKRPAAISPDGTLAYVPSGTFYAANVPGFVSVTNTTTNVVDATVVVGGRPMAVALAPDGARAYVVNQGSSTVSVIDTATHGVIATVNVNASPTALAVAPNGAHVYVAGGGMFGSVAVIDTATNTVVAEAAVGEFPLDLAITPDGKHLYVVGGFGELAIVDTAIDTVVDGQLMRSVPRSVAISPDGARAYLLSGTDLSVLDTATGMPLASLREGGCDVATAADGAFVYVTDPATGVDVRDAATLALVATIPNAGGCGIAMAAPVTSLPDVPAAADVAVEVKSAVNPKSNQKVPVAVLTTEALDALQIDPGTVGFGPAMAASHHGGYAEDVDNDGDVDMLFHFPVRATGIVCGDTEAEFVGATYDGQAVTATVAIRTVGCR